MKSIRQTGVTLVELLVALVVGGIILTGVLRVVLDSKKNFVFEQEIGNLQENGRFIVDELNTEIRMADFFGCSKSAVRTNTITDNSLPANWMFSSRGIFGFSVTSSNASTLPSEFAGALVDTDVLIVNRASQVETLYIQNHNTSAKQIFTAINPNSYFKQGDIAVVSSPDCENVATFQISNVSANAIFHGSYSNSPGVCSTALSMDNAGQNGYSCPTVSTNQGVAYAVLGQTGGSISRLKSTAYFLKNSPLTGVPTLYRTQLVNSGGSVTIREEELLTGIEDFDVIYGVDTDSSKDGEADRYRRASNITAEVGDASNGFVGWDRVVAVRATLILKTTRPVFNAEQAEIDLNDGYIYTDTRYMFQRIDTTATIRNRALKF